jgi:hypothetical protein
VLAIHADPDRAVCRDSARPSQQHILFSRLINGARLMADADEVYTFIADLYERNAFSFDNLVQWLRAQVVND